MMKTLSDLKSHFRFGRAERQNPPLLQQDDVKDRYDAIAPESDSEEEHRSGGNKQPADTEDKPLNKKVIIELLICILAFVGRGLCLNSVGPTLIDLRQIASMSIPQSAWIFVSQSTGFLIGSVLAKIILQRFNNELALGACLAVQAMSSVLIPAFPSKVMMCLMFVGQGFAIGVVGIGVCATCIRLGGKTRNGMFLQAVYLGVSIGSVVGPFLARPFLSTLAKHTDNHDIKAAPNLGTYVGEKLSAEYSEHESSLTTAILNITSTEHIMSNMTTPALITDTDSFTKTKVHFYYVIMGLILSMPAAAFFLLYIKRDKTMKHTTEDDKKSESLALSDCTIPLVAAIALMFTQCLIYFGMQDTYSNLLTTFAVLGPLELSKTKGVYLTSLFWASMAFGRLNGIWIAKLISPFKMLLVDMTVACVAATTLMFFAAKSSTVLWGFTAILGLSFATINGATVSWAANHLPGNNYILSLIMVGRCSGLLLLPTTVTALFKVCGPMTLMYAAFLSTILMLLTLVVAQGTVVKFGIDGKVMGRSAMAKHIRQDDDEHHE